MLEARDLTFGYNSDKTIYQGFNLTVAPRGARGAAGPFGLWQDDPVSDARRLS